MSDQELYEKIEAYLNGDLKGNVLSDFEARLQSDDELMSQVDLMRNIDSAIGDKPVLNFQQMVSEQSEAFLQEKDQKEPVIKIINWSRILIAAASIVLIVAVLFIFQNQLNSPKSGQDLFAQYFEPYELNESLRGTTNTVKDFDLGIQKYQSTKYKEATSIFNKLLAQDSLDMVIIFSLANAYLNQKPPNLNFAKVQFEKIIREGKSIYVPASKWYLALILLQEEDRPTAYEVLSDLERDGGNWSLKAKQLKTKLKD